MAGAIHRLRGTPVSRASCEAAGSAAPAKSYIRRRIDLAREPLIQFIVLGFLIWAVASYIGSRNGRYVINIGPDIRQGIVLNYLNQYREAPTERRLNDLLERYVREEIFVREGLALKLDQDDAIVRRRIIQKYEFLQTDLAAPIDPEPRVLEQWFEKNRLRYLTPERVAFSQVYFSPDAHGDDAAKLRALGVLGTLHAKGVSRAPDLGDAFPGPSDVGALTLEEAMRLLGDSEISYALFKLPIGQWSGPLRSGYGWHLVQVTGHQPPVLPALNEIHDRVLADYLEEQRQVLSERAYEKLREKYTVRYGKGG